MSFNNNKSRINSLSILRIDRNKTYLKSQKKFCVYFILMGKLRK